MMQRKAVQRYVLGGVAVDGALRYRLAMPTAAARFEALPRIALAHLPTPLEECARLSEALGGPRIYVKRDDATGLAFGGNKTRKLEYLAGAARAAGADVLLTFGGIQSNHARQTAAAAARLGFRAELVLVDMVDHRDSAYRANGNLLLDGILGARVHIVPDHRAARAAAEEITAEHGRAGRSVYVIPTGGSNAVGTLGYTRAYLELTDQLHPWSHAPAAIIHASSSGGTQAGLTLGRKLAGGGPAIIGVNVSEPDEGKMRESILRLACEASAQIEGPAIAAADIEIIPGYRGAAYGIPTATMLDAVRLAARSEGLLLDPVYTGKAMAALAGLVRAGRFGPGESIVFLHTGGGPGLFAYPDQFPH